MIAELARWNHHYGGVARISRTSGGRDGDRGVHWAPARGLQEQAVRIGFWRRGRARDSDQLGGGRVSRVGQAQGMGGSTTHDVGPVDRGAWAFLEHNRFCAASGIDALPAQAEGARVAERGRGWRRGAAGVEDEVHRTRPGCPGRPGCPCCPCCPWDSLQALRPTSPPGTPLGLALACRGSARAGWEMGSGVASTPQCDE